LDQTRHCELPSAWHPAQHHEDINMHTALDDTIDDAADTENTNTDTAGVPTTTVTAPPGMRLIDPLDLYLEREPGGDFFDGDFGPPSAQKENARLGDRAPRRANHIPIQL
jgi:hypothetical protein